MFFLIWRSDVAPLDVLKTRLIGQLYGYSKSRAKAVKPTSIQAGAENTGSHICAQVRRYSAHRTTMGHA